MLFSLLVVHINPPHSDRIGFTRTSFSTNPDAQNVWVINPENGHAYKKIGCRNPNDAIAQASKEDAHLVTINNAVEQNWLSKVFSEDPFPLLDSTISQQKDSGNGTMVNLSYIPIGQKGNHRTIIANMRITSFSTTENGRTLVPEVYNGIPFRQHSLKRKICL